jgi:hypothetical protein
MIKTGYFNILTAARNSTAKGCKPHDLNLTADGFSLISIMPNENKVNQDKSIQPTDLGRLKSALSIIVGSALMLACLVAGLNTRRFTADVASVSGTVTRLNAGSSHLQVQFANAAGEVVECAQNGSIGGY